MAALAWERRWVKDKNGNPIDANVAVIVFVRTLDDVETVCKRLTGTRDGVAEHRVQQLTGTMRGLERDTLAKCDPIFLRFLPEKNRDPSVKTAEGTVYLVCTSAGEVGVDISADHMACDLSTFESMAQRLGRVNRYGDSEARIDVVHPASFGKKDKKTGELNANETEKRRQNTLELLNQLSPHGENIYDASPLALSWLDANDRLAAFAPEPVILPATDILFDAWALTSIRQPMPGRPPVSPYLHGVAEWVPPETHVAWREEVELIRDDLLKRHAPKDLLSDYPLKPHELLRGTSGRVFKELAILAKRHPDAPMWVVSERETVMVTTLAPWIHELGKLTDRQRNDRLNGCTILLPPSAGGLKNGLLDGASENADDVADIPSGPNGTRVRIWSDEPDYENKTTKMRCIRRIEMVGSDIEDEPNRWEWFESLPLEGGRAARRPVALDVHLGDVEQCAKEIVNKLALPKEIADAIILAARLHDRGKRRERFQTTLGACRT